MKKVRGYMFSREFMGERVPQHIQNQVIRNYCAENNYQYLLSSVEYAIPNCQLILNQVINEKGINGIGLYSIFQLPENNEKRYLFLKKVISKKLFVCFCSENFILNKYLDIERVNNIWLIKKKINDNKDVIRFVLNKLN
tara:strand:+ start:256 stop:672 length:417 start_codon:yes stop_codon:yes gene_type:complete